MPLTQEQAVDLSVKDLAARVGLESDKVSVAKIERTQFPNGALGAPLEDEMSAMMMTPGWRIILRADMTDYEYRANPRQVRLFRFKSANYKIYP
jgi:hypothetical protein